jgi:hypothetical protein
MLLMRRVTLLSSLYFNVKIFKYNDIKLFLYDIKLSISLVQEICVKCKVRDIECLQSYK